MCRLYEHSQASTSQDQKPAKRLDSRGAAGILHPLITGVPANVEKDSGSIGQTAMLAGYRAAAEAGDRGCESGHVPAAEHSCKGVWAAGQRTGLGAT